MIRVILTSSRTWVHATSIRTVLDELTTAHGGLTLVSGKCSRGGDAIGENWARVRQAEGWPVESETHPADWKAHGRRAGIVRNNVMVAPGADMCVAFWRDGSSGTAHCMQAAARFGIPTRVYLWDDRDTVRWMTVTDALGQVRNA